MSARFTRRAKAVTFAGLATLGLAALAQVAVTPVATSEVAYVETLSQDPPITNSEFEDDENDCPGSPAQWGWHFILTGGEASFVKLTTTFEDAGTIVTTTFGPPSDKHAFVYTETDDTLTGATAEFTTTEEDPTKVRLVLSHTCDGDDNVPSESPTPTPSVSASETSTPTPSVSASETEQPSESPSESVTPSPSVSGVRFTNTPSTSPSVRGVRATRGPGTLPTTGSAIPVGVLVALGFGLVAAGMVATVAGEPRAAGTGGKHRR
jgi:hypothetical protein